MSCRNAHAIASTDNLTSFCPTFMPLITFICLTELAKPFRTILNSNDESGHPCLNMVLIEMLATLPYAT